MSERCVWCGTLTTSAGCSAQQCPTRQMDNPAPVSATRCTNPGCLNGEIPATEHLPRSTCPNCRGTGKELVSATPKCPGLDFDAAEDDARKRGNSYEVAEVGGETRDHLDRQHNALVAAAEQRGFERGRQQEKALEKARIVREIRGENVRRGLDDPKGHDTGDAMEWRKVADFVEGLEDGKVGR